MENEVKNRPFIVLSCGTVSGAVWVNARSIDNEVVQVHSIKFNRSYKDEDGDEWKHTEMFNVEDLLKVALLAKELYKRLRLRSYEGRQQDENALSNTERSS